MYNKLRQADSNLANDPNRRSKVNTVYGRLMGLHIKIDELVQYGDVHTSSADAEELAALKSWPRLWRSSSKSL